MNRTASRLALVFAALLLGGGGPGCAKTRRKSATKGTTPTEPTGATPAMARATPALAMAHPAMALDESKKWDCAADTDCLNSCSQGAVSRAWYTAHQGQFPECDDGCNNQISGPPRCLDRQCVAFDRKGMRRSYCTRKRARRHRKRPSWR